MMRKKSIFGALVLLSILLIIGTVGKMEFGEMPISEGVIRSFGFLALAVFFTYRAKLFYWQEDKQ